VGSTLPGVSQLIKKIKDQNKIEVTITLTKHEGQVVLLVQQCFECYHGDIKTQVEKYWRDLKTIEKETGDEAIFKDYCMKQYKARKEEFKDFIFVACSEKFLILHFSNQAEKA